MIRLRPPRCFKTPKAPNPIPLGHYGAPTQERGKDGLTSQDHATLDSPRGFMQFFTAMRDISTVPSDIMKLVICCVFAPRTELRTSGCIMFLCVWKQRLAWVRLMLWGLYFFTRWAKMKREVWAEDCGQLRDMSVLWRRRGIEGTRRILNGRQVVELSEGVGGSVLRQNGHSTNNCHLPCCVVISCPCGCRRSERNCIQWKASLTC